MDVDIEDHNDAFAVPALWRPSRFALPELDGRSMLFPPIELDIDQIKVDNPYAPSKPLEHDLRLPGLETFQYGPLEDVDSVPESAASAAPACAPPSSEAHDDELWRIATDLGPVHQDVKFHTWEAFEKPGFQEPGNAYMAEAGPEAFDAALLRVQAMDPSKPAGRIVRADILLGSLFNLGLGRSSVLFRYDQMQNTFAQAIADARMSGFSLQSAQDLVAAFVTGGSDFRYLRDFSERTFGSDSTFPARVALANAVGTIVSATENHLGNQRDSVASLLQLQNLFHRPHRILSVVRDVVNMVKSLSTNEELITQLYLKVQDMEQEDVWLRSVFLDILKKASNPWLEFAAEWTGLRHDFASAFTKKETKHTFVGVEEPVEDHSEGQATVEHFYRPENMPAFVPDEDGHTIFETGKSLRFLETHHPDHPLCAPHTVGVRAPRLDWKFDWKHMESIATKAKEYERNLANAIHKFSRDSRPLSLINNRVTPVDGRAPPAIEPANYERNVHEMLDVFDEVPQSEESGLATTLHHLVLSCISGQSSPDEDVYTFAPPLSITPTLSLSPLFLAQARLVNATTLRLFFRSHGLRLHISLQRQYQLLGDGVFMSRLTSALFSPELETAERRRGTVRTGAPMGLKLGSRSTWPPASSELRLALMGVLSESYHASQLYRSTRHQASIHNMHNKRLRETPDLPGNLSFAIRILSNEEIEKCMDPNSLYALDFLRLQYTPPPPLHLVMTTSVLDKYDQCFRLLLRIARMLFVVNHQLPRYGLPGVWESKSFRNDAHHFVSAVSAYFFDSGIGETWAVFETALNGLERRMRAEDAKDGVGEEDEGSSSSAFGSLVTEGLESVRAAHEECLDRILFALLLRRRQAQVMKLLEEIFEAILLFAKRTNDHFSSPGNSSFPVEPDQAREIRELYMLFRSKVNVFMTVCRGLSGKRGGYSARKGAQSSLFAAAADKGGAEENTIDRLLLKLEMNGYYSAPVATDLGL